MKSNTQHSLDLYDEKADEITASILGYLRAKGFVAWAQDNRGRYNPKTGKWYPHPNNRVGVPDIIGYRKSDARFIGVEVKAGKDRLSQFQIDFLDELKEHGGLPFVAFDFASFVASFERRGLHLPQPYQHPTPSTLRQAGTMATTAEPAEAGPACGGCRPSATARSWVAVAERLPGAAQLVLVPGWQTPKLAAWNGTGFHVGGAVIKPEYWQPLPSNPSK